MGLTDFFKTNTKTTAAVATPISPTAKGTQEPYKDYGARICGIVAADNNALRPWLQNVYTQEYQEQAKDNNKQQQAKEKIKADIAAVDIKITAEENNLQAETTKEKAEQDKATEKEAEIAILKDKGDTVNKANRTKTIVGLIILIPLTLYLFIFYSSTFYSAFFKDFSQAADLGIRAAMFDSQALSHAYSTGVTELLFVLCAPIIFMGLGFCLHIFMTKKDKSKWLKVIGILAITFVFDCILAYLIGKNIYDIEAMNSMEDMPPYSFAMAVSDINTWAVIFCGFIVYVIWGIVFDMTYTAYEGLHSFKAEIEALKVELNAINQKIAKIQNDIANINAKLATLMADKAKMEQSLHNSIIINYNEIKKALSDFFSGWLTLMTPLGKAADIPEAKEIYNETIDGLIPKTK